MAEQTTNSGSNSTQPPSKEGAELTPGRRSLPPKRGMLKKLGSKGSGTRQATGRPRQRTPITREDLSGSSSPQRQNLSMSATVQRTGRPVAQARQVTKQDFVDPGAERMKREKEIAKRQEAQRRLEEERTAQLEAERAAAKEKQQQEREEAKKRAEEARRKKKEAAAKRKAEQERIRQEQEAERKRLAEERRQREKELELKRIEEEKVQQEQERQRILKVIESCKGSLNDKEKEMAQKIADEMVTRHIVWNGYISLSSGIGAAVLRDQ